MKTLLLLLLPAIMYAQQDSVYAVQLFTTNDIDLVKREHISCVQQTLERAYFEITKTGAKVLLIFNDKFEAAVFLYDLKRTFAGAFFRTVARRDINKLF